MKQPGTAGGAAARRLASDLNGPRKRSLPAQIGREVAEALGRRSLPDSALLRQQPPPKPRGVAPIASCRRASLAATLRLARRNADGMRAYLAEREAERRAAVLALSAPSNTSQGRTEEAAPVCVICLEEREGDGEGLLLQGRDAAPAKLEALPCGHVFHRACISQWLQYKRRCPIDRQSVDAAESAGVD